MTIKRKYRICNRYEYWLVKKHGTSRQYKYFYLTALLWKNNPLANKPKDSSQPLVVSRVGVVITKKFDKKAVTRNKVKRFFKRAFRENIGTIPDGTWVVVNPRFASRTATYEEINSELTQALQEISLARGLRY